MYVIVTSVYQELSSCLLIVWHSQAKASGFASAADQGHDAQAVAGCNEGLG